RCAAVRCTGCQAPARSPAAGLHPSRRCSAAPVHRGKPKWRCVSQTDASHSPVSVLHQGVCDVTQRLLDQHPASGGQLDRLLSQLDRVRSRLRRGSPHEPLARSASCALSDLAVWSSTSHANEAVEWHGVLGRLLQLLRGQRGRQVSAEHLGVLRQPPWRWRLHGLPQWHEVQHTRQGQSRIEAELRQTVSRKLVVLGVPQDESKRFVLLSTRCSAHGRVRHGNQLVLSIWLLLFSQGNRDAHL
uniref:HAUS augmin-like complex subunit 7 n=1 Tax=Macrostomum lignano TaxID=282301 RepID=A0A1I8G6W4_9PLAT